MNLGNLGLCKASGKLISGSDKVVEKLKEGKIFLIILASDSGFRTEKLIKDKASFYNVKVISDIDSATLSKAIGESNKHVIGIMDRGFAKILEK